MEPTVADKEIRTVHITPAGEAFFRADTREGELAGRMCEEERTLWRIWDFMHLWDPHRELQGGDFVEFMTDVMTTWKPDKKRTPLQLRRYDADHYRLELEEAS